MWQKNTVYPSAFVYIIKNKKYVGCVMEEQYPNGFDTSQLKIFNSSNSFSLTF
jgi:hypothetical protein